MAHSKRIIKNIGKNVKIAIVGGTGLLGSNLLKLYSQFDVRSFSRSELINKKNNIVIDFSKLKVELNSYFTLWHPDVIINCVALTNLEECENNYEYAFCVNCIYAKELAEISKKLGSYFIQISTDHYYNDCFIKHKETDKIILLNNYSKTKYEAEKLVLSIYSKVLVVRTNIIGFRNNNKDSFFEWLINNLKQEKRIELFDNYVTSPIAVKLLGQILLECYNKGIYGLYNIASCETISKFNFGLKVAKKFEYTTNKIIKKKLTNENQKVKRALSLGLNIDKIEKDLGIKMPTVKDTINTLYIEFRGEKSE